MRIGGSCSFNNVGNGACQIVNPASVAFSGTLGAGQTATVSYRAQVADSARKDARLCIDTSVRFNNGQPTQAQSCVTVTCDPAGEGQPLPTAFSIHDGRPGSVLIYPIYTSSAANIQKQNTRLSLTNLDSLRGVALHLFLIDGATCQQADFFLCLTPNASFSFKASEYDPGNTGYVIAIAVNAQGIPIQNNVLIGNAFVTTPTLRDNYTAEAFRANTPNVAIVPMLGKTSQLSV